MGGVPGGLAFVFTDIEGSTRLVEQMQGGYGLALRICRRMLVNAFATHGGREFGTEGDGQFFVFPNAVAGATAALDGQAKIEGAEWPDDIRPRVRMGVHCGPVRVSGGEYVGITIHEVARICAAANGGQVLCSAPVATALDSNHDLDVRELGRYVLRGIAGARVLYEVCPAGSDAPSLLPREAVRDGGRRVAIWRRDDSRGDPAPPSTLRWKALEPGVDVVVRQRADAGYGLVQLTVLRDGVVEEEYDGLTFGGAADIADVVNAWSRLVSIDGTDGPAATR